MGSVEVKNRADGAQAADLRMSGPDVGKLRGIQQMTDRNGIFAVCAMDHRGSMRRMIRPEEPAEVSAAELVKRKVELTRALAPHSTAVLLDPIYGAAQAIAAGALPGQTALLVSLEETGYEKQAQGRITRLLDEWSVEKARNAGASAVKILLYYRPDLEENAARQREVVREVARECTRLDMAFVLEPIAYPVHESERNPEIFAAIKPELVIRSARDLTPLGIDVLKAEFPGGPIGGDSVSEAREACQRLDDASRVPWILLSAGVSFDEFERQVGLACSTGASGFLGGRAIWEEAFGISDPGERKQWLESVGAYRLRSLHGAALEAGRPWWAKWGDASDWSAATVEPDWYRRYGVDPLNQSDEPISDS